MSDSFCSHVKYQIIDFAQKPKVVTLLIHANYATPSYRSVAILVSPLMRMPESKA